MIKVSIPILFLDHNQIIINEYTAWLLEHDTMTWSYLYAFGGNAICGFTFCDESDALMFVLRFSDSEISNPVCKSF